MLNGDFSIFASAACQGPQGQKTLLASLGFMNNQISPAKLNPVVLAFVKTLPAPNDECGTTLVNYISNLDEDLPVGRIDFIKSSKQTFFGRFALGNLNTPSTYDGKNR